MPASKAEQVLAGITALLETIPAIVVDRNSVLPEKVPAGGLIILRDGDRRLRDRRTPRLTTQQNLPQETDFLRRRDALRREVQAVVDMPDRTLDLLFRFLHRNSGRLSARAREREFAALTEAEAERIEQAYEAAFGRVAGSMSAS